MTFLERLVGSSAWPRIRRRLPYRAGFGVEAAAATADLASLRLLVRHKRWDPAVGPVAVRARALGGRPLLLRPGSTDIWAFIGLLPPFNRAHVPGPAIVPRDARCVWDLGANIGATMAHVAVRFPEARVVGVELDAGNAAQARINVAPWGARCEVLEGAVWPEDGTISYTAQPGDEVSLHVDAHDPARPAGTAGPDGPATTLHAPALRLDRLLKTHAGPDGRVAFVKMDIEGAEAAVLADRTTWASAVDAISIEVHPPYTVDRCRADLERLGFVVCELLPGEGDSKPSVIARREKRPS